MAYITLTDLYRGLRRPAMVAIATVLGLLASAGCSSSHGGHPQTHPDGGAAGHGGAGGGGGGVKPDGGGPDQTVSTCGATGPQIAIGNSCGCDAECVSDHCVDGVCCATVVLRRLRDLRRVRLGRHLRDARRGRRAPHRRGLPRRLAGELRAGRALRRRGRLPQVPGQHLHQGHVQR